MSHNHQDATYPSCVAGGNNKTFGEKLRAFLGICGCLSCYVAMFPAILLGIVGIFGLSSSQTLNALNVYMGSVLFQPILVISILLLIVGLLRYGKTPLVLSILAGLGILASMNFYMTEWLFTLSFGILALAYYLAFRKTKTPQLKVALVLFLAVVILGVIDLGRSALSAPSPSQPHTSPNSMDPVRSQAPEAPADSPVHPVRDNISNGTGRTSNGMDMMTQ